MDTPTQIADIKRRLRGLKASRPASLTQVKVFEIVQSFAITLQASGSPGDEAVFSLTIVCSDKPMVSSALDDFILFPVKIVPRESVWTITGNTAQRFVVAHNVSASIVNETVTPRGFALNGISGTIVRIS